MTERETDRMFSYWLCNLPGVGNRTILKLLQLCGSPKAVYDAKDEIWHQAGRKGIAEAVRKQKSEWNPEREYHRLKEQGIRFLLQEDSEYPERLRQIPDPPFALFAMGEVPREECLSAALIGARDCSEYGRYVAWELGKCLGENGIQVISGMARGIDGISQQAAMQSGGKTFGVLGSGVDICYPKQNEKLYEDLQKKGGVLSVFPPGTLPHPGNFPVRNRIVSGLADVVVVIEARARSGTLITVDMALEQGKEVFVVPGRVTDRLSDGCNRLIRQGASVFLSPEEFLREIMELYSGRRKGRTDICLASGAEEDSLKKRIEMPPEMQKVYEALDFYPRSIPQILERLPEDYTAVGLNLLLMRLCMENLAVQKSPGQFCAVHFP